jgi:hypothetical protein
LRDSSTSSPAASSSPSGARTSVERPPSLIPADSPRISCRERLGLGSVGSK